MCHSLAIMQTTPDGTKRVIDYYGNTDQQRQLAQANVTWLQSRDKLTKAVRTLEVVEF